MLKLGSMLLRRSLLYKARRLMSGKPQPQNPEKEDPQSEQKLKDQQTKQTSNSFYIFGVMSIGLVMGYMFMSMQQMRGKSKKSQKKFHTGKADIGGQWKLIDTKGKQYGSKDLEGSYYLIYFGFCNCPDICPNSLRKLSKAYQKLRSKRESAHLPLKIIFVSVDPDRDSHQKIQKFLSFFDSSIIGVTGLSNSDPALRHCMERFKIYASKIQYEDQIQKKRLYTIDHTILTYLIDDKGDYLCHLGSNLSETDLQSQILSTIVQDTKNKMRLKKI